MHLFYLDDAGWVGNVREQHLVLGGVSVFEAQSSWVTQQLDRLAQNIDPGNPHALEFHVEASKCSVRSIVFRWHRSCAVVWFPRADPG